MKCSICGKEPKWYRFWEEDHMIIENSVPYCPKCFVRKTNSAFWQYNPEDGDDGRIK